MTMTKWTAEDGQAWNRMADQELERLRTGVRSGRAERWRLRDSQQTWRRVLPAARALIAFAYAGPGNRRQTTRWLRMIHGYPSPANPFRPFPGGSTAPLSDRWLRVLHLGAQRALTFPLRYRVGEPSAPLDPWPFPRTTLQVTYFRADTRMLSIWRVSRPHEYLFAIGAILFDALPWLRCCAVCARLFFKVRRQQVCGAARCQMVFQGRRRYRKSKWFKDWPGRGRPRQHYAATTEAIHAAWLTPKKRQ